MLGDLEFGLTGDGRLIVDGFIQDGTAYSTMNDTAPVTPECDKPFTLAEQVLVGSMGHCDAKTRILGIWLEALGYGPLDRVNVRRRPVSVGVVIGGKELTVKQDKVFYNSKRVRNPSSLRRLLK